MTKTKKIWLFWGLFYLICTVCGFIPSPGGAIYGLLVLLSLGFFVPPGMLIYQAVTQKDRKLLKRVWLLSIVSLGATLVTILLNFLAVGASESWGLVLYWLLILVSTPMICGQSWFIGLFGWACLLMTSIHFLRAK